MVDVATARDRRGPSLRPSLHPEANRSACGGPAQRGTIRDPPSVHRKNGGPSSETKCIPGLQPGRSQGRISTSS